LGSGLTIAGAMLCLSLTRMPIFQSIGVPCAVGLLVAVAVAVTLIPAVLAVASRFGLCEPKRTTESRRWRRIGTAIVRWPAPILATTLAVAALGLIALPGYTTSYNDRLYLPQDVPSSLGASAADRHFSQSRMMPDILMIESDHDLRNPADFLILHKVAKAVFKIPGIDRVQGITRPEGTPIQHTSIPFLISLQNAAQAQSIGFVKDRIEDLRRFDATLVRQLELAKQSYEVQKQLTATGQHSIALSRETAKLADEIQANTANFDDFFRPLRNYLYWEPHCFNIPVCWSLRSVFDAIDGISAINDKTQDLLKDLDTVDKLLPELLAQTPPVIAVMEASLAMSRTTYSTISGAFGAIDESTQNASAMGLAFDAAKDDDTGLNKDKQKDNSIRLSGKNVEELIEMVSQFIQIQNQIDSFLGNRPETQPLRNEVKKFSHFQFLKLLYVKIFFFLKSFLKNHEVTIKINSFLQRLFF
jgi:RND superfamily putative drug exporter